LATLKTEKVLFPILKSTSYLKTNVEMEEYKISLIVGINIFVSSMKESNLSGNHNA